MLKICVLLATAAACYGQSLQGTVADPLGAGVRNARITLRQGGTVAATASSDFEGFYLISSLTPGRYRLEVEAQGFRSYTSRAISVGAGSNVFDVLLQIGTLSQELVVSATGSAISAAQVGASIALIDHDQIEAENKIDLLENLRQAVGGQVVQTSQYGSAASLFIRGGESSFNKVLVDGVPVNSIGGGFDYAQFSTGGVESVEIMRGANSVLYGADALSGVVNITTPRGTTTLPEVKLSFDGGNFGTRNENVSLAGAWRKFDYFSQFGRFDTQGSYPDSFFHNATYAGNFGFQPDAKTDLRITFRKTWAGAGSPNAILYYGLPDDASQKNQNTYLSGTAQNQTTNRWHNLARFAFSQANSLYTNPDPTGIPDSFGNYLGTPVTIKGANGYSATGQAILDFGGFFPVLSPIFEGRRSIYGQTDYRVFGDWTATGGARYEHENGSGITRDNYGYFLETHGSIARRIYITTGVGLEDNAVFGFAASPRFSAAYYLRRPASGSFLNETKLRFNFGKGIKESSTGQEGSQVFSLLTPAQRAQFNVNPVGPERSRAIDFGVDQGFFHGRARLELTYFHNQFYDLITFLDPTALVSIGVAPGAAMATGFGAYVNANSIRSEGVEAQVKTELGHGWRIQGNYTYLDAVVTKAFGAPAFNPAFPGIPIGAFSPLEGERPFRRAPHSGSIGLLYSHAKFIGSFTGSMVGRRDDSTFLTDAFFGNSLLLPNRNLAPAYQKFDLSGRYALKSYLSLYTTMENLFSQHYQAVPGYPALPFTLRAGLMITIGGEGLRLK